MSGVGPEKWHFFLSFKINFRIEIYLTYNFILVSHVQYNDLLFDMQGKRITAVSLVNIGTHTWLKYFFFLL